MSVINPRFIEEWHVGQARFLNSLTETSESRQRRKKAQRDFRRSLIKQAATGVRAASILPPIAAAKSPKAAAWDKLQKPRVSIAGRHSETKPRFGTVQCVSRIQRTTKAARELLARIDDHIEYAGLPGFATLDNAQDVRRTLAKLDRKLRIRWVQKKKTSRKRLEKISRMGVRRRRSEYATRMTVHKVENVPSMRAAIQNLYSQGILARTFQVYPYRPIDSFNFGHRVNVYKVGNRFDVIDANCQIPILAGITKQALRKAVTF